MWCAVANKKINIYNKVSKQQKKGGGEEIGKENFNREIQTILKRAKQSITENAI